MLFLVFPYLRGVLDNLCYVTNSDVCFSCKLLFFVVGFFMSKRKKLGRKASRKLFSRTAQYVHPKNVHNSPMRGGFRL